MRGCFIAAVLALGLLPSAVLASEPGESGAEGIAAFESFLAAAPHTKTELVLGLVGFHGHPRPAQWLVLCGDPAVPTSLREFAYADGQIVADRKFSPLPGQDVPHLPLQRETLQMTSDQAYLAAESLAKARKSAFQSAHFQLRVRDDGAEPVWMLSLLDRAQVSVGVVYFSARTGEVLRETWVHPPVVPERGISAR